MMTSCYTDCSATSSYDITKKARDEWWLDMKKKKKKRSTATFAKVQRVRMVSIHSTGNKAQVGSSGSAASFEEALPQGELRGRGRAPDVHARQDGDSD